MRKKLALLLPLFTLIIFGCAAPGKESFRLANELAKSNRVEEAIAMYEDALAKEPKNPQYRQSLNKAKVALSERLTKKARSILNQKPLTYDLARAAYQEAEKALTLSPGDWDARNAVTQAKSELDKIHKKAEALYAEALKAMERNDWAVGVRKLREVKIVHPSYLDVGLRLKKSEEQALSYYFKEAERFGKDEEWDKVVAFFLMAQEIFPEKNEIDAALKEARAKHDPDYYLAKAETHAARNEWDMAEKMTLKAHYVSPTSAIAKRIASLRQNAALYYLDRCQKNLLVERLYGAYSDAVRAFSYNPSIKNLPPASELTNRLLKAMDEKATFYESRGQIGNALVWYDKILSIHQGYRDAFFKLQHMKERVKERVIKKIAIMDFTSPSGKPDAGKLVTDSLLSYITTQAGSEVKILARDVLGAILKEIELGQAGLYDIESAKRAGKLKGTDVFIFGSVLTYNVERNTTEGYRLVNVVVGKKTVVNPAYQTWMLLHRDRLSEATLRNAPPPTLEEEIRETVRYKVGTERKRTSVAVSFRVIDIEEGEVVITKTIKKTQEVKDDYSEGVPFANIPFDPLEVPADSELVDKVTEEVVAELSREVMSRFQNLQIQYSHAADLLKKKREYEKAVEKYVDVIHMEEIKNISGPLSENAKREIEQLLKQIFS